MGTKFNLSNEITKILNEEKINETAKKCGFVIRESKLTGFRFLDMLLFTHFNHKELSLNDLSVQLKARYGISIKKQSVNERFTQTAVSFFKIILEDVINISVQKTNKIDFTKYEKVRIKDSTAFQLPEPMQNNYPGSGGSGSKAGARIQFEYDLKAGKILDLSLHPYNIQDTKNAKDTIDDINTNELIIRDLAYTAIPNLKKIEAKGSFYLNRLNTTTKAYTSSNKKDFVELDFASIFKQMKTQKINRLEKLVYIGKERFKTRIIIELLPQKKYEQRVRKAKKQATKKGRKLGKNYLSKIGLNIFITNTDIKSEDIRILYTMRWQIELMFKIWKSIGEIDKIGKMKVARFEVSLFGKLIWIALNWHILWYVILYYFHKDGIKISPYKFYKTLKIRLLEQRSLIYEGTEKLSNFINDLIIMSPNNHKSEKKKNSNNWSYEIYEKFSTDNNALKINNLKP
jgi:hypothetical protein